MGLARGAAGWILVVLLTTSLVVGNTVAAGQRTVLDPEFTKNALAAEVAYDELIDVSAMTEMDGEPNASDGSPSENTSGDSLIDTERLIADAVPDSYVRSQVEANIDRLYAYLHGNRADLALYFETEQLTSRIGGAVEAQVRNASVAELLSLSDAPEQFGPLNSSIVRSLEANESGYAEARQEFRAAVRAQVMESLVDKAWEEASNDDLLSLVIPDYDPDDYSEREKAEMVAERETEIRTAIAEEIEAERGDDVDQQVDEELQAIAERATDGGGGATTEMEDAALDIQSAVIVGLTGDLSYAEFQSRLGDAKARLASAMGAMATEEFSAELPAKVSLTEEMGPDARDGFETAASVVGLLDLIATVLLPLIVVVLGLLWYLRRSVTDVGHTLAKCLLVAGVPAFALAFAMRSRLDEVAEALGGGSSGAFIAGFMDRVLQTVATQSLSLAVAGLVIYGLVFAARRDVLPTQKPT